MITAVLNSYVLLSLVFVKDLRRTHGSGRSHDRLQFPNSFHTHPSCLRTLPEEPEFFECELNPFVWINSRSRGRVVPSLFDTVFDLHKIFGSLLTRVTPDYLSFIKGPPLFYIHLKFPPTLNLPVSSFLQR